MKQEFENLFEYNHHFNAKYIELIEQNSDTVSDKIFTLINHTINAQQIWNARILKEIQFDPWQINDWKLINKINDLNYKKSLTTVNEIDAEYEIIYQNSKGIEFSNKIKDILFHIVNHSTYHRAQIASELKNCKIEPINSDYIFYKRN